MTFQFILQVNYFPNQLIFHEHVLIRHDFCYKDCSRSREVVIAITERLYIYKSENCCVLSTDEGLYEDDDEDGIDLIATAKRSSHTATVKRNHATLTFLLPALVRGAAAMCKEKDILRMLTSLIITFDADLSFSFSVAGADVENPCISCLRDILDLTGSLLKSFPTTIKEIIRIALVGFLLKLMDICGLWPLLNSF